MPPDEAVTPMSVPAAVGWVAGIHFCFLLLVVLVISSRKELEHDMVAIIVCQLAMYGIGVFGLLRVYAPHSRIRDFLGTHRSHWGIYPLALLIGASATVPTTSLLSLIEQRWPIAPQDPSFTQIFFEAGSVQQWMIAAGVVVLAPLIEETLFRGAIFVPLRKSNDLRSVIITSALLFALVHHVPQRMIPLFCMGALMGYLRASSGTLWASVLAHAAFNAVPMSQMMTLGAAADEYVFPDFYLLVAIVVFALALGAFAYLVRYSEEVAAARAADG